MFKRFGLTLVAVLLASISFGACASEGLTWLTNFEAAKAKAKEEKKLMLLDFTGSDWCIWCWKLHAEVFDWDAFKNEAPKKFILVALDYPNQKQLPPEEKEQNTKLQEEFKITGFPTILIADADGRAVARTGYQPGGPEKYISSLNDYIATHDKLAAMKEKLSAGKGVERAKMIDEFLKLESAQGIESDVTAKFQEEIIALDADNKEGLKTKYTYKKLLREAEKLVEQKKFDEAKAAYEKALETPGISAEQKQDTYTAEAHVAAIRQKDYAGAAEIMTKARKAAPASEKVKQIDAQIRQYQMTIETQAAVAKLKTEVEPLKELERAKKLDQLATTQSKLNMLTMNRSGAAEVEKLATEIMALDADNKEGLKAKYTFRKNLGEAEKLAALQKFDEAKAAFEKMRETPEATAEQKQEVYLAESRMAMRQKDFAGAAAILAKARDAEPTSRYVKQIDMQIKQCQATVEALAVVAKLKAEVQPLKELERAKKLDELVAAQTKLNTLTVTPTGVAEIERYSREILALDADNKAGLKTQYECKALMVDASIALGKKDFAKADDAVAKALNLPGLGETQKQSVMKMQNEIEAKKSAAAAKK